MVYMFHIVSRMNAGWDRHRSGPGPGLGLGLGLEM